MATSTFPWTYLGFKSGSSIADYQLYDKDLINADLMNCFNTLYGSLDWRPNYGSKLKLYLFENQSDSTETLIAEDIKSVIATEPRVELLDYNITAIQNGYQLQIVLNYINLSTSSTLIINFFNNLPTNS